jgi:hypothetical protein
MDQRVSVRRFIVPVVLAGVTLCGTLAWSSSAAARDPAGRIAVTSSHMAASARASHPMMSHVTDRSASTRTNATTGAPSKTVSLHFTRGTKPIKDRALQER